VWDDDVLDIGTIELREKLFAELRDGRFDIGGSEGSFSGRLQPGIVDILS
jgi:hypothetical protein